MTTATQSNTILRNSIHLLIINMVNVVSVFLADCTGVVVSFSNRFFKMLVECGRIFFISPAPLSGLITHVVKSKTQKGAILVFASMRSGFATLKRFAASMTRSAYSLLSINIVTLSRAKLISTTRGYFSVLNIFSANNAGKRYAAAILPTYMVLSLNHNCFCSTLVGAKARRILSAINYVKRFSTTLTVFIDPFSFFGMGFCPATHRTEMKTFSAIRMYFNTLAAILASNTNSLSIRMSHDRCP